MIFSSSQKFVCHCMIDRKLSLKLKIVYYILITNQSLFFFQSFHCMLEIIFCLFNTNFIRKQQNVWFLFLSFSLLIFFLFSEIYVIVWTENVCLINILSVKNISNQKILSVSFMHTKTIVSHRKICGFKP